jgi:hypothetical protein
MMRMPDLGDLLKPKELCLGRLELCEDFAFCCELESGHNGLHRASGDPETLQYIVYWPDQKLDDDEELER